MPSRTCVVVSYWVERSPKDLHRLLRQMMRVDAGAEFDLLVVCNGGDLKPIALPARFDRLRPRVLNRENVGYNIGAWDAGWRAAPENDWYLFLQDDCFLKKAGWLSAFEFRMTHDIGIGLLGESMMWDRASWPQIIASTERDFGVEWWRPQETNPLEFYKSFLEKLGILKLEDGSHLQTMILFSTKKVLQEIGGLPYPPPGATLTEAIAREVALSRLVESKGYRIAKVEDEPFQFIGHRQWTWLELLKLRTRLRLRKHLRQFRPSKDR